MKSQRRIGAIAIVLLATVAIASLWVTPAGASDDVGACAASAPTADATTSLSCGIMLSGTGKYLVRGRVEGIGVVGMAISGDGLVNTDSCGPLLLACVTVGYGYAVSSETTDIACRWTGVIAANVHLTCEAQRVPLG